MISMCRRHGTLVTWVGEPTRGIDATMDDVVGDIALLVKGSRHHRPCRATGITIAPA
jgi:hypothetical protein